jgi:hypothetical protein
MRLRVATTFVMMLFSSTAAVNAQAQCQLIPATAETMTSLENQLRGSTLDRQRGLVYLDAGCLAEARHAFEQSSVEAVDTADFSLAAQQAWTQYLLELADGYEAWKTGNLVKAKEIFAKSSDEGMPHDVNQRAVFALAELLMQNPDPILWKDLEQKLIFFDEHGFWKARRYRMMYGLTPANAEERIRLLESKLAADLPVAERLEDETILAEVLAGANRLGEAELLTRDMEEDVGLKAVAVDLRAEYVRVCMSIAGRQVEFGNTRAQARLEKYQSALREMYAPQ